ncbi:MAG: CHAD domain-containing protein [Thermoanaerobaculia bacterium]
MQKRSPAKGSELGAVADAASARPSQWTYEIERSTPETEAVAVILRTLLDVMEATEDGVRDRLDEEFLHDYRVAVRRTRSALALFKGVLPLEMHHQGGGFFKELGKRTNEARDLDVLSLALPVYAESLAERERAGLPAIEDEIAVRIENEYAGIRSWLGSQAYERRVADWRAEIERLSAMPSVSEISARAATAIRKAASRAHRQIEEIGRGEADAEIHRLRIGFKGLRYALEFSRTLTAGGEVENFLRALKRLQDELGAHQDLVVHRRRFLTLGHRGGGADATGERLADHLEEFLGELREAIRSEVAGFGQATAVELERVLAALA